MTERERLKKLIGESSIYNLQAQPQLIEQIADHLLANGVIVPPCKVGDTVWFNTFKKNATVCVGIQPHKVDRVDVLFVCDTNNLIDTKIPIWQFGKTVFLTKEEAEKALREVQG